MNTPYDWEIHFLRGRVQAYNDSRTEMEMVLSQLMRQEVKAEIELERLEMVKEDYIDRKGRDIEAEKGDGRRIDRESETMPRIVDEEESPEQEGETPLVEQVSEASRENMKQSFAERPEVKAIVEEGPGFGKFDETADNDPTRDAEASQGQIERVGKAAEAFKEANEQGGKWTAKEAEANRDKSNDR